MFVDSIYHPSPSIHVPVDDPGLGVKTVFVDQT
jgi:hypothetical protein